MSGGGARTLSQWGHIQREKNLISRDMSINLFNSLVNLKIFNFYREKLIIF